MSNLGHEGSMSTRTVLYLVHFTFFTILVPLILYILAEYIRSLSHLPIVELGHLGVFVGVALVTVGVTIMIMAEVDMYRYGGGGTPIPFYKPPKALVNRGVYRCTRNPMYLGTTLEYLGTGLLLSELLIVLFSLIILSIAMLLYRVYEEPYLRRSFKVEFEEYADETPILIPKIECIKEALRKMMGPGADR